MSRLYDTAGVVTADYFEGHDNLITLNHSSSRVQEYVREVMVHWLRRGIDGWRLDAAYAVPPSFWAAVLPAVREEFPDAWFVGEMIHGDYVDYVKSSGLDSVTEYELWWAIWSSIDSIDFHQLEWTLGRHAEVRGSLPAVDVLGQPRRDPGGQPDRLTLGTGRTRWRCSASCQGCRASITATSSAWRLSKRTAPAATTPYDHRCRASGGCSRTRTPKWSRSTGG